MNHGIGAAVRTHLAFNRFNERKNEPPLFLAGMPANRAFQAAPGSILILILRHFSFDHFQSSSVPMDPGGRGGLKGY